MIKSIQEIGCGVEDFDDWVNYWDASEKDRVEAENNYHRKMIEKTIEESNKPKRKYTKRK